MERKIFIIMSLLLFIQTVTAQDAYWDPNLDSSTVLSDKVTMTVDEFKIDNADDNNPIEPFSFEVKMQRCRDGCVNFDFGCQSPDNRLDADDHPSTSEPDGPDGNDGDDYPGTPDTRSYDLVDANVQDGDDYDLQGFVYESSDCSGSTVGQFFVDGPTDVEINSAPDIDSFSASPSDIVEGESTEFSWDVSDSDGSVDSVKLDADGDGSFEYTGLANSGTESHTFSSTGDYTAEIEVTDDDGATSTDTTSVSVGETCEYSSSSGKTVEDGDDVSFDLPHNDGADCEQVEDVKFNVCAQNVTSDITEESTGNDPYSKEYSLDFTVTDDVSCNIGTHDITWYNDTGTELSSDAELTVQREKTKGTPIHENGKFKPDSEIIVATQMERASFYNPSQGDFANRSDTFFFACRGQYRGPNISHSKLVKVQEGDIDNYEWQHYRCAMNGSWMEANCQPGMEIRYDSDNQLYRCYLKDSETIHATYFDIEEVPYTGREEGYLAGFKITENEIDQYEDMMGFDPQKVDAECWMGEDNQRPANVENSTVFTSTYDGSGDFYAVAEIPGREGVNQETYSCVWGMKNVGSTTDTNVYESTNNDPLLAKDGGKTEVTYDEVELMNSVSDIDEGTPRSVWSNYRHPDDGGLDERTYELGNHFFLNGEYPYCSGNNFFSSNPERDTDVLSNIICEGGGSTDAGSTTLSLSNPSDGATITGTGSDIDYEVTVSGEPGTVNIYSDTCSSSGAQIMSESYAGTSSIIFTETENWGCTGTFDWYAMYTGDDGSTITSDARSFTIES